MGERGPATRATHRLRILVLFQNQIVSMAASRCSRRIRISLYLHVPFCPALCLFCALYTGVPSRPEALAEYAAALRQEIALLAATIQRSIRVRHLHWGGGTPSMLGPIELTATMDCLRQHFIFVDDCEIAIELDPRRITPELLWLCRRSELPA